MLVCVFTIYTFGYADDEPPLPAGLGEALEANKALEPGRTPL
ncbi:MAG: hypothetical protein ACUZ77_07570 [Candidatus Brocadiales bacterium]